MGLHLNHKNSKFGLSRLLPANWSRQTAELVGIAKSLLFFLAIALLLRVSVVEAFKIPSTSMVPTLEVGDHIFVNKLAYGLRAPFVSKTVVNWGTPDRGDIVVFTLPDDPATPETDESDTNIIKRVIGLPGETIRVSGMSVFINGVQYKDPHARWLLGGVKDFGPVTIPEGHILMLGDNRDQSRDSRFWENPFLDLRRIKGRAFFIYWNSNFMMRRIFSVIR